MRPFPDPDFLLTKLSRGSWQHALPIKELGRTSVKTDSLLNKPVLGKINQHASDSGSPK
jgi:hypothetical protein